MTCQKSATLRLGFIAPCCRVPQFGLEPLGYCVQWNLTGQSILVEVAWFRLMPTDRHYYRHRLVRVIFA